MNKTFTRMGLALAAVIVTLSLLAPLGARAQEQTLYAFTGGKDGANPNAVILGADGNLYGTASGGGASNLGVVFELTPVSGGGWTSSVIHNFTGAADGAAPNALIFGADGNLYGTAYNGGNVNCPSGCGTVFKMVPVSGSWQLSVIHTFKGRSDGHFPIGLTFDAAGNLYGTTHNGGLATGGGVSRPSPSAPRPWTVKLAYSLSRRLHGPLHNSTTS